MNGILMNYEWNINGIWMEYWLIPSGIIKHGKLWRNPPVNRGSGKSAASKFQSTKRNQKRTMFRKYVEYSKPKFRTQENQWNCENIQFQKTFTQLFEGYRRIYMEIRSNKFNFWTFSGITVPKFPNGLSLPVISWFTNPSKYRYVHERITSWTSEISKSHSVYCFKPYFKIQSIKKHYSTTSDKYYDYPVISHSSYQLSIPMFCWTSNCFWTTPHLVHVNFHLFPGDFHHVYSWNPKFFC